MRARGLGKKTLQHLSVVSFPACWTILTRTLPNEKLGMEDGCQIDAFLEQVSSWIRFLTDVHANIKFSWEVAVIVYDHYRDPSYLHITSLFALSCIVAYCHITCVFRDKVMSQITCDEPFLELHFEKRSKVLTWWLYSRVAAKTKPRWMFIASAVSKKYNSSIVNSWYSQRNSSMWITFTN